MSRRRVLNGAILVAYLFVVGYVILPLGPIVSEAATKTWRTSTVRGLYVSADRGVDSDSVLVLSTATLDSVVTLSGDTANVYTGGTVTTVTTRRKWITSANGQLTAYPAIYTGSDTTGQGIDLTYIGGSRNLWYLNTTSLPTQTYNLYETGGSPDSAITDYVAFPVLGYVMPDSSIPASALERGAVGLAEVDTNEVVVYRSALSDTTVGKTYIPRYVPLGNKIQADSFYTFSTDKFYFDAGIVRLEPDAVWVTDTLGVAGDVNFRSDLYVGGDGTEVLSVDHIAPILDGKVQVGDDLEITATGAALILSAADGYDLSLIAPSGMAANKTFYPPGGMGTSGYLLQTNGSTASSWTGAPSVTSVTASGAVTGASVVWQASSNTHTYNASATASNLTSTMPAQIFYGKVTYNDTSGPFRQAYYVAGMTTSHVPVVSWCSEWWDTGTNPSRVLSAKCVTDSLIIGANASISGYDVAYWAWRP